MARPNRSEEKRRELLPAIARAFAELGYRGTTTAELARRCSVRENVLYRLWPDKRSMFMAVIGYVFELSETLWQELIRKGGGARSEAERLLEYEAAHHGEYGFYRIVFAGLSESEDPEIRDALRRMYLRFQGFIRQRIDCMRDSGGPGPDPALRAWALLGLGTIVGIGREFGLMSRGARERLLREAGRLLLEGGRRG